MSKRVVICNGGRYQGHVGVIDMERGNRVGVLLDGGRIRVWVDRAAIAKAEGND